MRYQDTNKIWRLLYLLISSRYSAGNKYIIFFIPNRQNCIAWLLSLELLYITFWTHSCNRNIITVSSLRFTRSGNRLYKITKTILHWVWLWCKILQKLSYIFPSCCLIPQGIREEPTWVSFKCFSFFIVSRHILYTTL